MVSVREQKRLVEQRLIDAGIDGDEARCEANLILEHATGYRAAEQIMRVDEALKSDTIAQINQIVRGREERVPLQYCLGYGWFFAEKFVVRPGVFIPRTDTETVVSVASDLISRSGLTAGRIGEVGIGSGVISVSLLKKFPALNVIACDVNQIAIEVSRENARRHNVSERLTLLHGDWRGVLPTGLDAIVSNPPYIPRAQLPDLAPEVRDHEPHAALFGGGADGLEFYEQLAKTGKIQLRQGKGFVVVEVGDGQAEAVVRHFVGNNWEQCNVHLDVNGLPRAVSAVAQ